MVLVNQFSVCAEGGFTYWGASVHVWCGAFSVFIIFSS